VRLPHDRCHNSLVLVCFGIGSLQPQRLLSWLACGRGSADSLACAAGAGTMSDEAWQLIVGFIDCSCTHSIHRSLMLS